VTLPPPRPTVPQARPLPAGPASGPGTRVAGARRPRTGGRVAGQSYAPPAPKSAGKGSSWPFRDYTEVHPAALRETYEWWQDICRDVAPRRRARRMEQADLARDAGISLNTVQRIERGDWTAAHNLFLICSVLGLRVEQTVDVTDPRHPDTSDRAARRALARPVAQDRIATRAEVLAGRAVLQALASHHELRELHVDLDGVVYARAGRPGFAPLWRFASLAAQALGVWVDVRPDVDGAANRAEAERL
jgi:transcriptional regulator with XRE-family HTH domain